MTLTKKADRVLPVRAFIACLRSNGMEIVNLGDFRKWKELRDGSRLSVKLTLYRASASNGKAAYFFSDSLDRIACAVNPNLEEMTAFLRDHGYKSDHDFYVEDYGMTEESYREWNSASELN